MSGFTPHGEAQVFELTATKGSYWHRYCNRRDCRGPGLEAIAGAHLIPAGFEIHYVRGGFIALSGPGIAEGSTDELYDAVSGKPRY